MSTVRKLLTTESGLRVMGEVAGGLALLRMMEHTRELPEVVLSDITMPGIGGLEAARRIKAEHPNVKIIILTIHREQEYLEEALSAGVEGYVLNGHGHRTAHRRFRGARRPKVCVAVLPPMRACVLN